MERRLIQRSLQDEHFRQQLLADPKAIIEREIGRQLPEEIRVVAVQETADTIYLVLPSTSQVGEGGGLADLELEAVAGGDDGPISLDSLNDFTCDMNCGSIWVECRY